MRLPSSLVRVVAGIVLLAGCQALPGPDPDALDGTAWIAVSVAGRPVVAGAAPTLRFDGMQLSGSTGCNTYGAGYGLVGNRLSIDGLYMTRIACEGPIAEQERRFIEALLAADRIELRVNQLSLVGPRDSLEFVPG